MFVLKPTGTIYYSLGLAAEKPAGSSSDLLFFPAFLCFFSLPPSRIRLKTKLCLPSLFFFFFCDSLPLPFTLSVWLGEKKNLPLVCLSVLEEEVAWLDSDGGVCLFLDLVGVL